jgi:hypothetical protein
MKNTIAERIFDFLGKNALVNPASLGFLGSF